MVAVGDRHILILGGGASGTLLAIQLLRAPGDARVTIIEKRAELGRGFAYGEAQPFHLLNVRAANMSAYPDAPDHFIDWLDRNGVSEGVTGEGRFRFVPRLVFGRYISDQLDELAGLESNRGRLTRVHGEAVALTRTPLGVSATMADGRRIAGTAAVIATGFAPPRRSELSRSLPSWKAIDPASLRDLERVLIVGTGHSGVDHVLSLIAAGYQGAITMISRRGLLPLVHRPIEHRSSGHTTRRQRQRGLALAPAKVRHRRAWRTRLASRARWPQATCAIAMAEPGAGRATPLHPPCACMVRRAAASHGAVNCSDARQLDRERAVDCDCRYDPYRHGVAQKVWHG
jgi:uncharacterized NAD(P)/FAD-binding protein YdhS